MIRILPAILSHTTPDYLAKLEAVTPHFTEAQVDFMDGVFVTNKTLTPKDIKDVPTSLRLEAHLMVSDPTSWISQMTGAHFTKVIVHQEIGHQVLGAVRLIKSLGLKAGLAINPETDTLGNKDLWGELDCIQVMGVVPGHYGAPFDPGTSQKVRQIRDRGFQGEIEVDGGINVSNAANLRAAGAQTLVVGSYFFGSEEAPQIDKIGEKLTALRTALGITP